MLVGRDIIVLGKMCVELTSMYNKGEFSGSSNTNESNRSSLEVASSAPSIPPSTGRVDLPLPMVAV